MDGHLSKRFDKAMFEIYRRAKSEAGYTATIFLQMLNERGGLQNISGYRIAVDEQLTEVGAIAIENGVYSDTIVLYDRLDTVDWRDVLLPFFQRIWLTFDRERPAKFRS